MIKKILLSLGVGLLLLVGVLLVNTFRFNPIPSAHPVAEETNVDLESAAGRLAEAITFRTISTDLSHPDFPKFVTWLETAYPNVHRVMERSIHGTHTPLYKWAGSDASQKPVLFTAHYDIVPVLEGTDDLWEHPPFSGVNDGTYIWGRGTLDDKGSLIAMLDAAETLIQNGFTPKRDIYFSFGADEEIGGAQGAGAVVAHLKSQNIQLAWSLDEGSFVLDGIIAGLKRKVASINISEKGYLTLDLIATGDGGHSSMPPRDNAVAILAQALNKVSRKPVPGGLTGTTADFFDALGREFGFVRRMLFANRWLFAPILNKVLSGTVTTNAVMRTTTAPTMLSASQKENVLPIKAVATVNFRLHPRDTSDDIIAFVNATIDDERVDVVRRTDGFGKEASPVSSATSEGYLAVKDAIERTFGDVASIPGLTIAATDSVHYSRIADNSYRIAPFRIEAHDLKRFHGTNERLSLENLRLGIGFYSRLLETQ